MKTLTAAALGVAVGLTVGVGSGAAIAGIPDIKAPHQCTVMANRADDIADLWDDLTGAVNKRGNALDPETYAIHDAEFNHLDESLTVVEAEYVVAKAACLGDS